MSQQPQTIQVIGQELAVIWPEGQESYYPLEKLRRNCPCAVCAGEADLTGQVFKPPTHYNEKSFFISKLDVVGGYALQPQWGDGHDSGLYTWQYLRRLAEGAS